MKQQPVHKVLCYINGINDVEIECHINLVYIVWEKWCFTNVAYTQRPKMSENSFYREQYSVNIWHVYKNDKAFLSIWTSNTVCYRSEMRKTCAVSNQRAFSLRHLCLFSLCMRVFFLYFSVVFVWIWVAI